LKAWYVGGKPYIDIDDAALTVVSLVGDREREIYNSTHDDPQVRILKEARLALQDMCDGDVHDFMGVIVTIENLPWGF
jgi:predicted oxidoreductase